jgi:zinc-binding alcohol dehydrogenase family protein
MKAIGLTHYLPVTDEYCLKDITLPLPHPNGQDLLIKVEAISVNPVDTKVRAPKDLVEDKARILGWDAYGTVVSVGDEVSLFSPGQKVFYAGDISRSGCNSEFHLVNERIVGHAPEKLTPEQAAAIPLTALTAWEALFSRLNIDLEGTLPGDSSQKSILIIGGAGGVGSIACQLASNLAGLTVIATASRPESTTWCKDMGADYVVNHHDLMSDMQTLSIKTVDYILCCNDTDMHFDSMAELIAPQGHICSIVDNTQPLALNKLKTKSASFSWEFMFTRALFNTDDMIEQHHILNEVARLLDEGILKTTLKEVLSPINAKNLRTAHAKLEQGSMIGKLVLSNWD